MVVVVTKLDRAVCPQLIALGWADTSRRRVGNLGSEGHGKIFEWGVAIRHPPHIVGEYICGGLILDKLGEYKLSLIRHMLTQGQFVPPGQEIAHVSIMTGRVGDDFQLVCLRV